MLQQGDCFHGKLPRSGPKPHFWFVLTNPDQAKEVVLVNVTTPDGPTKAQLLKKATYAELEYDSIVFWRAASCWPIAQLELAISKGAFTSCPSLGVAGVKEMVAEGEVRGLIPTEILRKLKAGGC